MDIIVSPDWDTQVCERCEYPESWRPVRGFEGLYEISSAGRARTVPRVRPVGYGRSRRVPAKLLVRRRVSLRNEPIETRSVLRWVLFLEHYSRAPMGAVDVFVDGDGTHLCVGNLAWEFPGMSYRAMHRKVERHLGKAVDHSCLDCGGPACEWSYSHSGYCEVVTKEGIPYSLDPAEYGPRCRPCHRHFDAAEKPRSRDSLGRFEVA